MQTGTKRKLSEALDRASGSAEIQDLLTDDGADDGRESEKGIRHVILRLEKAITRNQEMRLRFANEPQRFMDSEIRLDAEIEALGAALSNDPSSYTEFVRLSSLDSCLSLLMHENVDIVIGIVKLFHDLFDVETAEEEGHLRVVIEGIVKSGGLPALVDTIERFDESQEDDREAVGLLYSMFESMVEADYSTAAKLVEGTRIVDLALNRVSKARQGGNADANRFAAADLVAVLLTCGETPVRVAMAPQMGRLLAILAPYIKEDAPDEDERGLVENVISSVQSMLLEASLREPFADAGGLHFCIDAIRYTIRRASRTVTHKFTGLVTRSKKLLLRHGALSILAQATERMDS